MLRLHYENLLYTLFNNYDFFRGYFASHREFVNDFNLGEIKFRFGAARGCIIENNFNYVLKFDFETTRWLDGCEHEFDVYERARQAGFEDYFAQPIYLGTYVRTVTYNDAHEFYYDEFLTNEELMKYEGCEATEEVSIPMFVYPKVRMFGTESSYDSSTFKGSMNSPLFEEDDNIGMEFIKLYGEEEYYSFSEFLREENVNDIHSMNCGYIGTRFVLTDYCGFGEDY